MLPSSASHTAEVALDRGTWRDMLREHFVSLDVAGLVEGGGSVESNLLGQLQLSTVTSRDQVIQRKPSLINRDGSNLLQIGLIRSGAAVVEQDGRRAVLGPGDFVVYETSRPFEWSLRADERRPHWELGVFTWPRAGFRLPEARTRDLTARTFTAAEGVPHLISTLLAGMLTEQPAMAAGGSAAVADQVGELLAVALDSLSVRTGPAGQDRLLQKADEFIDAHLSDPDLSPETVARAVAISVRQLHRLFLGRDQTVAQTIRARRLEGARREINSSLTRDRSIREIARNWGYLDLAVFGRAFRQVYGLSPRQYRAAQCSASGDPRAVVRPRR